MTSEKQFKGLNNWFVIVKVWDFEIHSKENSEYVEKDEIKKLMKKYKNWRRNMNKERVDHLRYEARFWYVKTLDLADFKYAII